MDNVLVVRVFVVNPLDLEDFFRYKEEDDKIEDYILDSESTAFKIRVDGVEVFDGDRHHNGSEDEAALSAIIKTLEALGRDYIFIQRAETEDGLHIECDFSKDEGYYNM